MFTLEQSITAQCRGEGCEVNKTKAGKHCLKNTWTTCSLLNSRSDMDCYVHASIIQRRSFNYTGRMPPNGMYKYLRVKIMCRKHQTV
jgi:hypothetical protein